MRTSKALRSAVTRAHRHKAARRSFPYLKVAQMWADGMTIQEIARKVRRIDRDNPGDPYHSLRNFLYRMHKGYKNENGDSVKLPHRVPAKTVRAARKAGLRAFAAAA